MNELLAVKETMSSLQIAEITGKLHTNILRDIRNLLEQGINEINFELVEYTDKKGEKRSCYNLTKKGCLILASGYNALLREKIINRWEELEMQNKNGNFQIPKTYSEALMIAAKQAEQLEIAQSTIDQQAVTIDLQNQELTTQAPKVQYYDNVLQSKSTYTTTQIAKELGMSARQLNKKLQTLKFIFHQSGMWMLTAKYQNKGLATTKTYSYTNSIGQTCTNTATVYTEKGREFIHSLLP